MSSVDGVTALECYDVHACFKEMERGLCIVLDNIGRRVHNELDEG